MLSQRWQDRSQTWEWLGCRAGHQEVGRCHTTGDWECVTVHHLPSTNKAAHSTFKTQRRRHQKFKTGVPVTTQNPVMDQRLCGNWNSSFGFLMSSVLVFKVRVDLLIEFHIFLSLVYQHWSCEHCDAKNSSVSPDELFSISLKPASDTCVTAAGSFTVRPRGSLQFRRVRNYESAHGVRKTLSRCQQNLFYLGGPGSPHQQGWGPCSSLLSQLLLGAMVIMILILNAKVVSMVPMTCHGARCTVLPMLLTQ